MQNIENINYASDSGAEAIKKLDRNQRKIKEHLDTINVDGMQQQINNLNDVPNADTINVTDANELPCGWYSGNLSNSPSNDWFTYHTFYTLGSAYRTQIAYGINNSIMYVRIYLDKNWEAWQEISTKKRKPFYITPSTGIKIVYQNCYILNNVAYVNVRLMKTDETVFVSGTYSLFTSPYYIGSMATPISATFADGWSLFKTKWDGAILYSGECKIDIDNDNTIKTISIHAEVAV